MIEFTLGVFTGATLLLCASLYLVNKNLKEAKKNFKKSIDTYDVKMVYWF